MGLGHHFVVSHRNGGMYDKLVHLQPAPPEKHDRPGPDYNPGSGTVYSTATPSSKKEG